MFVIKFDVQVVGGASENSGEQCARRKEPAIGYRWRPRRGRSPDTRWQYD